MKLSEDMIDKAIAAAFIEVEKQAKELKSALRQQNAHMLGKCQSQRAIWQKKEHDLQTTVNDAKKLLETGSSHEYLRQHTGMTKKFIGLEINKQAEDTTTHDLYQNSLIPEKLYVSTYAHNPIDLGVILFKAVRKLSFQKKLGKFSDTITGIATGSDGKLVVAVHNKSSVEVLKRDSNGQMKHQFNVTPRKKNWYPYGVAVTNARNILVAGIECVEVYSPSGKHERSINTSQCEFFYDNNAVGVTTTTNGHILLGQLHSASCAIDCYLPDGRQCTQMDNGNIKFFLNPWKLAAIGNEYVVVSNLEDKVHVFSFKHGSKHLNSKTYIDIANPTAICYDEKTDSLLVAHKDAEQDAEDGAVIEQYCWRNGAKIATLARGLKDPQDMAFTDDGMLAVADDKEIKFYKATTETLEFMDK